MGRRITDWGKQAPLIVISFGSMSIPSPAELLSLLSSALDRVNARAVVCANWDSTNAVHEEKAPGIHDRIYVTDQSVPHAWLLRHATGGFVHHGGAGHTGAGLRAGVPMLVLPFMLDQHFWAAQVYKLGLGPPLVPFRLLTADRLTESLQLLLDGGKGGKGTYSRTCAEMAECVRAEGDGADVAAEVILRQLGLHSAAAETASDESMAGVDVSQVSSGAPMSRIPCSVLPALVGPWRHKATALALSGAAAACLVSESVLSWDDLETKPSVGERYWSGSEGLLVAWVQILSRVPNFISCAVGILWLLMTCVVRLELPQMEFRGGSLKARGQMSDVCHRAHIEQAEHDLEILLQQSVLCGKTPGAIESGHTSHILIRRGIVSKWNAAAVAKHHIDFLVE
jgi:hypothetical protein